MKQIPRHLLIVLPLVSGLMLWRAAAMMCGEPYKSYSEIVYP